MSSCTIIASSLVPSLFAKNSILIAKKQRKSRFSVKPSKFPIYFAHDCRWFNGAYSKDNLSRIKNGANAINFEDKQSKGTHCVSLSLDRNTAVYFDSFGIEYIQEVLGKVKYKPITHNIL